MDCTCNALVYACLAAIMTEGPGAVLAGHGMPVVSSAGALVSALAALDARRIALIAPYAPSLTDTVVGYLAACGVQVVDAISLGVTDNVEVGRHDPVRLIGLAEQLDVDAADAVVLSVCVALPSLPAVPVVERRLGHGTDRRDGHRAPAAHPPRASSRHPRRRSPACDALTRCVSMSGMIGRGGGGCRV